MERTLDEAGYVLAVLQKMRDEVSANPTLFDPGAQQRMDEAIVYIQDVIRPVRSKLVIRRVEQKIKAAWRPLLIRCVVPEQPVVGGSR